MLILMGVKVRPNFTLIPISIFDLRNFMSFSYGNYLFPLKTFESESY